MLGTAALAGLLVTSQAVANADTMTIKAGDTVWAYSQKYNVSIDKIAAANDLSNPNLIIAGKTIDIPGVKTGAKVATKAAAKTTTASASSAKSTSAATSTSSQATSVAANSSSVTSASSTSQAVSSSSVAAQSSSTSTASASSSVASSASTSSVASQASSSAATSSAATQSSVSTTSATSSTATSTSSQASSSASTSTYSASSNQTSASTTTYSSSAKVTATAYSASTTSTSSTTTGSASALIAAAKTYLGTPYEQMDCSAFTQAAFAKIGRSIGRTTYAQATIGSHVSFSSAQAGDLIFWGSDSAPYHVGIYLGGGSYIASPTNGAPVSIKSTAYYTPSFAIHMF